MLVADALMMKGLTVVHIVDEEQSRTHELSPALRRDSSELVYDNVVAAKHLH
jgi:transposase